ncbi:MAG: hypothetical protein ACUVUR_08185, partial [bacterium]
MPVLAAIIIYLPTLTYQFVWDDINLIVYNRSGPLNAFSQSFWSGSSEHLGSDPYYRPLVNFSLRLDRLIAGRTPLFFHLGNVLIHSMISILLAVFIIRITGSFIGGIGAGLVFALHPLFADCVAYVSGRTDLLAGLGVLMAGLGIIGFKKNRGWLAIALSWLGYAVGIFSKESAVFFIFVIGGWFLLTGAKEGARYRYAIPAGAGVILAGYLIVRYQILGKSLGMRFDGEFLPLIL